MPPSFFALDQLRADLDALRPLAPEQEARVLQKFRLEWNYNSNAIEGNSLTLGETRSLLLHGLTAAGKPMRDHLDIKGHNDAVLALEDFVRSQYPLTEQFIREMHQLLLGEPYEVRAQTPDGQPTMKRIVPGRYKTSPNNVLTATGEMFYFASVEETPARMTDLVDWYRAEEAAATLHPVALAARFHYDFVRIHPFDDGNGRMSRLLMNLILLRHGYPMTVIKADDRNRYLAALSEADAGEFEPFLQFIVENVEASLQLMIRAARGESIDEPSDLDKKLALLKKQIIKIGEPIEIMWNKETQINFYTFLLKFWLSNLLTQIRRFDFAFVGKVFKSYIFFGESDNKDKSIESNSSNELVEIENLELWLNDSADLAEEIVFGISWQAFKSTSSYDLNLAIIFLPNKTTYHVEYSLHSEDSNSFISGDAFYMEPRYKISSFLYQTEYDHAQIHEINHQLANKVYDFIAAKVAEADINQ